MIKAAYIIVTLAIFLAGVAFVDMYFEKVEREQISFQASQIHEVLKTKWADKGTTFVCQIGDGITDAKELASGLCVSLKKKTSALPDKVIVVQNLDATDAPLAQAICE